MGDLVELGLRQDLLEFVRRPASLGGMGFVGDDRKGPTLESGAVGYRVQGVGEGLDGDDDDVGSRLQGLGQFRGFRAGQPIDVGDDAGGAVDLVDRLLQLRVEHGPVGDHDDGGEHLVVIVVVQSG